METRQLKFVIARPGGNASKNAVGYKMGIPSTWAQAMGISPDTRNVTVTFDGDQITIKKSDNESV